MVLEPRLRLVALSSTRQARAAETLHRGGAVTGPVPSLGVPNFTVNKMRVPVRGGLHADLPLHQFHQPFADRGPSPVPPYLRAVELSACEGLEHLGLGFRGEADSGINDFEA